MRAFLASMMLVLICWHGLSVYLHLVLFLSLFCRFLKLKRWIEILKMKHVPALSLLFFLFLSVVVVFFFLHFLLFHIK